MPTQLQFRRGNTAQTGAFTGVQAEITVDTEKNLIVVHDGLTAGGFPAASMAFAQAAYDSANNSAVAGLAFDRANAAFNKANTDQALAGSAFDQANLAYTQANTGTSLAQAAFNSANNVAPQIQPAFDKANTAYNAASDAYNFATTANVTANAAFIKANTGVTIAQAAFDSANNVAPQIQPSFDTANAAFTKANTAFTNAGIASTYANNGIALAQVAFNSANNVAPQVQPAFDKANAAFTQANTAYTQANSSFTFANAVYYLAQGAFVQANTVASDIITLSTTSNAAFTKANASGVVAQAAYNEANTKLDKATGGTIAGDVTFTSNVIFSPSSNISFTGNVTSVSITGNTGQFFGYTANGFNAFYAGLPTGYTPLPNEVAQFTGANNSYIQINFENLLGGTGSTTDWVATADNGTNYSYYVDMGIAGSGYDNSTIDNGIGSAIYPNDSYLYAMGDYDAPSNPGGNVAIGAGSTGKVVRIFAGGLTNDQVALTVSNTEIVIARPLKFEDGTTQTTSADLAAGAKIVNQTVAFTTTDADQVLDTFDATVYRTAKYIIQSVSGSDVDSREMFLMHDGTNVLTSQYAQLNTQVLFTLAGSIVSGNVVVTVTPTLADTTIDFVRTGLTARTLGSGLEGDLMSGTGTEDLDSGTGTEDLGA